MSKAKNLETAIRDAERNYSVGRILDAARDFHTVSIVFGGMRDYSSAAKFAVRSGDCWVECGDPLRAGGLYESAAQYFELLSDEDSYRLYYKKALVQCVLADRKCEDVGKVALARNFRRAAVCQCKLDENETGSHYYVRAAELFISAAKENLERESFDEAFDFYNSAAKCYFQVKEYLISANSRIEALKCLNKLFESYLSLLKEEEYREIMKRELKRFINTTDELLKNLELVDRMDREILERLMFAIITGLKATITPENGNEEIVGLLERTGKMIREKGECESGLEILEGIIPKYSFNDNRVREEFIRATKTLKGVLEG